MTPSTLPQKCWKPLDDVKAYVGRFPDGVDLTMLNAKVCSYATLPKKEKLKIIDHLRQRESIDVIKLKKEPGAGRHQTILRHKKYNFPHAITGEVAKNNSDHLAENEQQIKEPAMTLSMPNSPEAIRKEAERLLQQAEEMERKRNDTDLFNKKLAPVKLEICQAAGALQRKTDEFIDCIDTLNKAIQKLKDLSA